MSQSNETGARKITAEEKTEKIPEEKAMPKSATRTPLLTLPGLHRRTPASICSGARSFETIFGQSTYHLLKQDLLTRKY